MIGQYLEVNDSIAKKLIENQGLVRLYEVLTILLDKVSFSSCFSLRKCAILRIDPLNFSSELMKKLFLIALLFSGAQAVYAQVARPTLATTTELVNTTARTTTIRFTPGAPALVPVNTPRGQEFIVTVDEGTPLLRVGAPDLNKLTESVIIPNAGQTNVVVVSARYHDVANVAVAPSKGNLYRDQDPATVPYTYGEEYTTNAFYPSSEVELRAPYCLRDYRGQAVVVYPFRYNAVTKTLRVYEEIIVRVESTPGVGINELNRSPKPVTQDFDQIYRTQFINYEAPTQDRYTPTGEQGEMLIISHANYMNALAPFILWKNKSGIKTTLVDIATIGNNASAIKSYVANFYSTNNCAFVLLVGDAPEITPNTTMYGPSDEDYGMIVGSDHYPDLLIGRFSVSNVADVNTIVARTLEYECNPIADTYYETCLGIGSNQGPGDDNQMDYEHEQVLGAQLLAYNYNTFIEMYDGSQGGGDLAGNPTQSMCGNAINDGVGIINYTGHGSSTSIVTTGFNNSNVNALTNEHKWPFVIIVGCVTGDFVGTTCFAEAWQRATHPTSGNPTGSCANFMSTINQSWDPPMEGQDEMNAILTETYSTNIKRTVGGICVNGCLGMNDAYGAGGDEMTDTWTMFGDPSMMLRTLTPMQMTVTHPSTVTLGATQFTVNCSVNDAKVTLYQNGTILGTGIVAGNAVTINFPALSTLDTMWVTATAYNYVPYQGYALVVPASGPYVISASHLLTDPTGNNNNIGDFSESVALDVSLSNVGMATASSVSAVLSTTDPYVTIVDANESFGNIAASALQSQTTCYTATIASNVPDMHVATFTLTITDNASNTWTSTFTEILHAPSLTAGSIDVDDATGNANGIIDPTETFNVIIPTGNAGHSTTPAVLGVLSSTSPFVTINNNNLALGTITVSGIVNAVFSVTVSGAAAIGTTIDFTYTATAGAYAATATYYERVGIAMEDYETNSFTQFPWVTSGNQPWFTTNDNVYDGLYCSKSGAIISNQSSVMSITLNVLANDSISFFRSVSSEQGYDFLNFYIDNVLRGSWSGVEAWGREAYAVTAGSHTFKWEYKKDQVVDGNLDCAWIDNVIFPAYDNSIGILESSSVETYAAYPNPTNGPVVIDYTLAKGADVAITVIDAQGRLVATIQQNAFIAAGDQRATWSAEGLAEGIYFINLTVDGKTNVQRIVVH